jgi:hypothetical protein
VMALRLEAFRCYPICEECGKVSPVPFAGEAPPPDWRRWVGRWPDLFTCSLRCAVLWLLSNGRRR